jgi:hypothetical protein
MKRITLLTTLLTAASVARVGWAEDRNRFELLVPPRQTHPFGAIETRPRWERPAAEPGLQRQTEDALDRGTGRIEDEPTFELRQLERERVRPLPGELDRYRAEHERQERVEQQRMQRANEGRRQQRLEREADALADARRRWMEARTIENAAASASVVDRQALERAEADYRAALTTATTTRQAALQALDEDPTLPPDARAARRAAILEQFNAARTTADQERERRRALILGWRKE